MLQEYSLEGRSAVVTGASRGIGRAIALALAEAGADVAVAARTKAALEETAQAVGALGRRCEVIPTDVTSEEAVNALIQRAIAALGKVDVLVNNAGMDIMKPLVAWPGVPLSKRVGSGYTLEEWNLIQATNLTSAFLACRAVGPHMLERGGGKIINISSVEGMAASRAVADIPYAVSKAGLNHFTRLLALEWARFHVNVNAIAPGAYDTEMWNQPHLRFTPEDRERQRETIRNAIPWRQWGDLRDLGLLAVYLASEASNYMTGQVIALDGGLTA